MNSHVWLVDFLKIISISKIVYIRILWGLFYIQIYFSLLAERKSKHVNTISSSHIFIIKVQLNIYSNYF